MSILVKNITKIYGEQRALDDISFSVEKGQILGFLGPNGAGKTTTMKILSCFIPQTKGYAEVMGYDVTKEAQKVKHELGYLPEHNPLYTDMYVKEYLRTIARIHKVPQIHKRVEELIDITGLSKEQNKKIESLSKGYRQRVGLAQAIIHNPNVLILDEPTSGLDPNQLVEIRELIRSLGKDKIVIFSSHIMQEVEALCDRVIIINQGKLVADDPISLLSQRVKGIQKVTVEYESVINEKEFSLIEGVQDIRKVKEGVYELSVQSDVDVRAQLFDLAVQHGNRMLALNSSSASVEHIFQELTKSEND